jgi:hypothetical protein
MFFYVSNFIHVTKFHPYVNFIDVVHFDVKGGKGLGSWHVKHSIMWRKDIHIHAMFCTMWYVQYQLWNCYVSGSGICLELCLTFIIKVQCKWWTALRLINGLVKTNTTNSHAIRCSLFLSLHCFVEFYQILVASK